MKHLSAFLFLATLLCSKMSAQAGHFDYNVVHNWNYLDRDLEMALEKFSGKNGLRLSVHCFQNTAEETFNWQDKPRATTFAERWGLGLTYLRYVPIPESNIEFYPYLKAMGFRLRYQTQNEQFGLVSEDARWKFYSALGLQVKSKVYRSLYLTASIDAGARWEKRDFSLGNDFFNGLSSGGSVGLAYRFSD